MPTDDPRNEETPPPGGMSIAPGVRVAPATLRFRFDRSSGPGGQNVNKVATQATLTVHLEDLHGPLSWVVLRRLEEAAGHRLAQDPSRLVIRCGASRSQTANKNACLEQLRDMIVAAQATPKRRRPTRIPMGVVRKRLRDKRHRADAKRGRRRPGPGDD